jgi:hypothetical protein
MEKNGNNLINLNLKFITFLIGIVGIDIKWLIEKINYNLLPKIQENSIKI